MQVSLSGKETEQRLHLHYLDGLRGLAALYVMLLHIHRYMGQDLPVLLLALGKVLRYGHFAVVVFIVLSGYVLMLPVVRSHSGYLSGGLLKYLQKRSRRILPPYYVTLAFSLLLGILIVQLDKFSIFPWHESVTYGEFHPNFSFNDVLTHLLLIHNFSRSTLGSINAPMWSVAVEWQIYFLFPLLLVPIWRRFNLFSVIAFAYFIGLVPFYLVKGFDAAHSWFLGLFALGMVAVDIGFSQKPQLIKIRKSLPWNWLAIIFTIFAFITEWQKLGLDEWIGDSFCALATACLLIYCTHCITLGNKKRPIVLRLLETRWLVVLGGFSYSLYLTHGVTVTIVGNILLNLQLSPVSFFTIFYLVAVPLSVLIAYCFYLAFERPFMSNFLKKNVST
ncbi:MULTISPECIES: acyltransferase family protein [Nostocales]|uniref:Acyltransferase n=3 Tax=Nostocales TaxID=1161 RepID=A0A0C1R8Y0_9CYAN|nr:acyltransferase [Tolypothrix bouteillei]KAF3885554.1 acyltransferase [Tolypothrix bouteillei VB521301]